MPEDDRTQAPSKRRRQQARERGQVARSAELNAAVGLLAAVVLLGAWGDDLASALVALVREPLLGPPAGSADPAGVVDWLRRLALGVAIPLGGIVGGVAVAILAAHQAQVGGLWVPGLLAPDPARLWGVGAGPGLAARWARGAWALAKALVVAAVAAWAIRSHLPTLDRLGHLEPPALARASGALLRDLAYALALATLALGLIDYALQYRRFEALLRLSPQEQREDQRADDGDPALRARRRRLAQARRRDPGELLIGASLVLTGPAGLAVVLAGGPPPRRISGRGAERGASGLRLRQAAERAGLPRVEAPDLARRLARNRAPGLPLPEATVAELVALWPPSAGRRREAGRPPIPDEGR